ncbi:hypothetical protein [uncultured Methanobrevibacter sp.]|uniref:hypothetical protein n=1 Tax=uncultured Methanobrevibacter sp. TaxID=253161 RepID=UPI00320A71C4
MDIQTEREKIFSRFKQLNYKDLIIFLIPVIIFSFYLYVYNPGILTFDSFNQVHQIASGRYSNWHPFFHTFIEMLLYKIYSSPISVGIFQILTFSIIWMVICKYFRNNDENINFADIKSDREFIIQSIITLIICLIPINAIYSITLWKDVLFSYAILFLCFLIKVLVDKKCKVSIKFIILMGFVMACVAQLRLNGIYVIVPLLIIMAYYLYRHDKTEKFFIKLPVIAIIFILLIASLNVVYNVEDNAKDATLSKTTHMLANYDLYHKLDAKDSAKFHELINETAVKDNYKTFFTDPVRNAANESVFEANKGEYIGMAVKYSLQDPIHFIKYMLSSSEITWDITRDSYWQGKPYYINEDGANLESSRNNYFKAYHTKPVADYENVTGVNEGSGLYNMLNSFVYTARTNVVLDTLFESPALYMFLSILAMAGIYYMTKSKDIILVYLPNLFNILVVFVSIPTQDNRYLYPNLLVFYLLVIIIVGILAKQKLSSTPKTAATSNELPSPQEDSDAKIDAIIDNLSPEEIQSILNEPEEVSPTQNAEDDAYDELDAIIDNLTPEEVSSILNEPEEETSPKAETVEKEDVKKQEEPKETQTQEKPKQEAQKEQNTQQQTKKQAQKEQNPQQQTKKQAQKQEIPPMKTIPKQQTQKQEIPPMKTIPKQQTQKQVVFQKEIQKQQPQQIQKQQRKTTQKQQPQQIQKQQRKIQKQQRKTTQKQQPQQIQKQQRKTTQKQQPQQRKVNKKQFSKRKETKEQMEARIRAKVLKDLEREKQNKK